MTAQRAIERVVDGAYRDGDVAELPGELVVRHPVAHRTRIVLAEAAIKSLRTGLVLCEGGEFGFALLALLLQRYLVRGLTLGAVKG